MTSIASAFFPDAARAEAAANACAAAARALGYGRWTRTYYTRHPPGVVVVGGYACSDMNPGGQVFNADMQPAADYLALDAVIAHHQGIRDPTVLTRRVWDRILDDMIRDHNITRLVPTEPECLDDEAAIGQSSLA